MARIMRDRSGTKGGERRIGGGKRGAYQTSRRKRREISQKERGKGERGRGKEGKGGKKRDGRYWKT